MSMPVNVYVTWLTEHLDGAKTHYGKLCKLDDHEQKTNGHSEYYEQAHQMFGYIAALEKCLREAKLSNKTPPLKATRATKAVRTPKSTRTTKAAPRR